MKINIFIITICFWFLQVPMVFAQDANNDGYINLVDFGIWKSEYLSKPSNPTSDFNNDAKIDLADFSLWEKFYLNPATSTIGTILSCRQASGEFTPSTPIPAYQFTYPAVIRTQDESKWLMFTGGIYSLMPKNISTLSVGPEHLRFTFSQEEIWQSESTDLINWSKPNFSFNLLPETPVAFKNNQLYKDIYPNGFKTGCTDLLGPCNSQINDPTVVRVNGSLYLYFTILENYRWYDGSISLTDHASRNKHSTGLAVSADDGKSWSFVDKVIPEDSVDTDGRPILGAWAPSAVANDDSSVDIFFHDSFGTKQYVAHLEGGAKLKSVVRLNKSDDKYRVNLDVIKNGDYLEFTYNDDKFNIVRTISNSIADFAKCEEKIIVSSNSGNNKWPTPHQVIFDNQVHLYFWSFADASYIHHWIRSNN